MRSLREEEELRLLYVTFKHAVSLKKWQNCTDFIKKLATEHLQICVRVQTFTQKRANKLYLI